MALPVLLKSFALSGPRQFAPLTPAENPLFVATTAGLVVQDTGGAQTPTGAEAPFFIVFDGADFWASGGPAFAVVFYIDQTGTQLGSINPGIGSTAVGGLLAEGSNLWETTQAGGAGAVALFDTTTKTHTANFSAGATSDITQSISQPLLVGGDLWYVNGRSSGGSTLVQMDTSGTILHQYTVAGLATSTGFTFDGTNFWIGSDVSNDLLVVDPTGNVLSTYVMTGNANVLAFDGARMWVGVSDGTLQVLNLDGSSYTSFIGLGPFQFLQQVGSSMWGTAQTGSVSTGTIKEFGQPAPPAASNAIYGTFVGAAGGGQIGGTK